MLSFVENFQSRALDRRYMDKHVATAVIRFDETIAALAIKKLDRTGHGHRETPLPDCSATGSHRRMPGHSPSGESIGHHDLSHSAGPHRGGTSKRSYRTERKRLC